MTHLNSTWKLGPDAELELVLVCKRPLPAACYTVIQILTDNIEIHADALRVLLIPGTGKE
jgi:hypothetical protein